MGKRAFPPLPTRPQLVAMYPALLKTKSGLKAKPNFGFGLKTEPQPSHGQTRKALKGPTYFIFYRQIYIIANIRDKIEMGCRDHRFISVIG